MLTLYRADVNSEQFVTRNLHRTINSTIQTNDFPHFNREIIIYTSQFKRCWYWLREKNRRDFPISTRLATHVSAIKVNSIKNLYKIDSYAKIFRMQLFCYCYYFLIVGSKTAEEQKTSFHQKQLHGQTKWTNAICFEIQSLVVSMCLLLLCWPFRPWECIFRELAQGYWNTNICLTMIRTNCIIHIY